MLNIQPVSRGDKGVDLPFIERKNRDINYGEITGNGMGGAVANFTAAMHPYLSEIG